MAGLHSQPGPTRSSRRPEWNLDRTADDFLATLRAEGGATQ